MECDIEELYLLYFSLQRAVNNYTIQKSLNFVIVHPQFSNGFSFLILRVRHCWEKESCVILEILPLLGLALRRSLHDEKY